MLKDVLKYEREKLGLSQAQLSKKLNVSQQTVGSWETGRTQPSNPTLEVIANFFGVSVDYLLGREIKYIPKHADKSMIYETYGTFLSIDEQLDILIQRLEDKEAEVLFKNNALKDEARLTLLNSLKSIRLIVENMNKDGSE